MNRRSFLAAAMAMLASAPLLRASRRSSIEIGLIASLFRDTSENALRGSINRFQALIEQQTGYEGQSTTFQDLWQLAEAVRKGQRQLGVCQGFEFAWLRGRYPALHPLVVAVNQQTYPRAYVLVHTGSTIQHLVDLQGKSLAIPKHTQESAHLFLERACQRQGRAVDQFFARVLYPATVEDGLDDVVDNHVQSVLTDSVGLSRYQSRKPTRSRRLQQVVHSQPFPPVTVFYQPGAVDQDALSTLQRALLNLTQYADGRQVLLDWKLSRFERMPADYDTVLKKIAEVYPRHLADGIRPQHEPPAP